MSLLGGMGMFGGSSFLNAAGSQHGGTFASRILRPYQDFETPWGKGPYWSEELMNRRIQGTVADAKAAGIHPLFALGGGGGGGGGAVNMPHRPRSGGGGGYSGGGRPSKGAERRAQEAHEQNLERGHVELLKSQSELRRIIQLENAKRPVNWPDHHPGTGGMDDSAVVYPMNTKRGLPVHRRPLQMTSRSSIPQNIETVGDDGYRYRITNPELGDEVSEADFLWEATKRNLKKMAKQIYRDTKRLRRRSTNTRKYKRRW